MTEDDDGFLSRWSRLKRARPEPEPEDAGVAEAGADAPVEDEDEAFDADSLPDPDTLGPGDDFTVFLKNRVPEELRRRALRRLWRSNPVLACVDGLNDYDGDYRGGGVPVGQLKTAFEVGRGLIREASTREEPPAEAQDEIASVAVPDATAAAASVETPAPEPEREPEGAAVPEPEDEAPARTLRRMSFDFPDPA